ncbi:hypothetical protein ACFQT0_03915 [Hymenobacter humi]|uniref:Uncharacterized protein n=1 Tax=Hymenobacter humi TaxID=1411620 RepID=A0ABW2TZJ2_9BACT
MWERLAYFIIRFRLSLIAVLAVITVFMAWKAKDVEMTYDFAQVVSPNDPDMIYFQDFKRPSAKTATCWWWACKTARCTSWAISTSSASSPTPLPK